MNFSPRRPQVRHAGPLVIGVMGHINAQKGARVVAGIAERIEKDCLDARVVVLGTLEATQVGLFTVGGASLATGLAVAVALRMAETLAILVGLACLATASGGRLRVPGAAC